MSKPATVQVQLAYPYAGKQPDDVITVDAAQGKRLIQTGWARVPDRKPPTKASKVEPEAPAAD